MTNLRYVVYVGAAPDDLWRALTDPDLVPRWRFGMRFQTDLHPGSRLVTHGPDGQGTVREADPGRRLVYDWTSTAQPGANGSHPSTVTFALAPIGEVTELVVTHADLEPGPFLDVVSGGWPKMLSSLKSMLETGEPLRYG